LVLIKPLTNGDLSQAFLAPRSIPEELQPLLDLYKVNVAHRDWCLKNLRFREKKGSEGIVACFIFHPGRDCSFQDVYRTGFRCYHAAGVRVIATATTHGCG